MIDIDSTSIWHCFLDIILTSFFQRYYDVISMSFFLCHFDIVFTLFLHHFLLKKWQNGVLFNKMLNVILSTTGSYINVDASWWAQIGSYEIYSWNILCINILSVCECITLLINTVFWCWNDVEKMSNWHLNNVRFLISFQCQHDVQNRCRNDIGAQHCFNVDSM